MDILNDEAAGRLRAAEILRSHQTVVGAKQLRKALNNGSAIHVFLAENADPALTAPIVDLCREKDVAYTWLPDMEELGRACRIEVGAAAAAAVK